MSSVNGTVTVDGASASAYIPPAISAVIPAVTPFTTRGGDRVRLVGTNFGAAGLDAFNAITVSHFLPFTACDGVHFEACRAVALSLSQVYYGPASDPLRYTARQCAVNVSAPHTQIQCVTTTGVGSNHVWSVTVGEQLSVPSTDTTRFATPTVTRISGPGTFQAKTDGGQSVTITGNEFGTALDTVERIVVTYGRDGLRFTAEQCVVTASFTSIQCVTAPGTGKELNWFVTVDGQRSSLVYANTSYGQPVVAYYNGTGTVDGSPDCEVEGTDCGMTQGYQIGTHHTLFTACCGPID